MVNTMGLQVRKLVQAAALGDEDAFTELVARHHRDLLRVAYVICRDPALAEDSAQTAWAIARGGLGTDGLGHRVAPDERGQGSSPDPQLAGRRHRERGASDHAGAPADD